MAEGESQGMFKEFLKARSKNDLEDTKLSKYLQDLEAKKFYYLVTLNSAIYEQRKVAFDAKRNAVDIVMKGGKLPISETKKTKPKPHNDVLLPDVNVSRKQTDITEWLETLRTRKQAENSQNWVPLYRDKIAPNNVIETDDADSYGTRKLKRFAIKASPLQIISEGVNPNSFSRSLSDIHDREKDDVLPRLKRSNTVVHTPRIARTDSNMQRMSTSQIQDERIPSINPVIEKLFELNTAGLNNIGNEDAPSMNKTWESMQDFNPQESRPTQIHKPSSPNKENYLKDTGPTEHAQTVLESEEEITTTDNEIDLIEHCTGEELIMISETVEDPLNTNRPVNAMPIAIFPQPPIREEVPEKSGTILPQIPVAKPDDANQPEKLLAKQNSAASMTVLAHWPGDPLAISSVRRPRKEARAMIARSRTMTEVRQITRKIATGTNCSRRCAAQVDVGTDESLDGSVTRKLILEAKRKSRTDNSKDSEKEQALALRNVLLKWEESRQNKKDQASTTSWAGTKTRKAPSQKRKNKVSGIPYILTGHPDKRYLSRSHLI